MEMRQLLFSIWAAKIEISQSAMNDLSPRKITISELSNEALFKMVNEDLVDYEKEELSLAYDELERRGVVSTQTDEKPRLISPVGCLLAVMVLIVELVLTHQSLFVDKEFLSWPRALALAAFVALMANYWDKTKFHTNFWKHLLCSVSIVLLGSLALWDLPNLLRQRIPIILAFGIPATLFATFLLWFYEFYLPKSRQKTGRDNK
jgi:hypothetical protein